jgi:nucleoside-diphosphate-sugar epimerase
MRVLILGGTRFIGWHIASTLRREGHRVAVFHRGSMPLVELSGIEEILGDKTKLPDFRDDFRRFRPDAVIVCIGYSPSDGAKIVETFKGWLVRLIFLSSCDVYRAQAVLHRSTDDPLQNTPLHEGSPLRTNAFPYPKPGADPDDWRYDYDKIPIERLLLEELAFQTTVLRLPAVYGPRDYQRRVWEYLRKMDAGRKAIVVSESLSNWRWSRGYVENVAAAVSHALSHQPPAVGVFNLSDPVVLSQQAWIESIAEVAAWDGNIVILPDDQLPPPLRLPYNFAQDWSIDASHFRKTTGFADPFTLKESVRKTVEWQRANPPELSAEEWEQCRQEDDAEDQVLSRA